MADLTASHSGQYDTVVADFGRTRLRAFFHFGVVLVIVLAAAWYVNLLDIATLANGLPAILTLARESFPPTSAMHRDGGSR